MEGVGALLANCPSAGLAGGQGVTACAAAGGVLLYKMARRIFSSPVWKLCRLPCSVTSTLCGQLSDIQFRIPALPSAPQQPSTARPERPATDALPFSEPGPPGGRPRPLRTSLPQTCPAVLKRSLDTSTVIDAGSICSDCSIKKQDDSSHSSSCMVDITTKGEELMGWRGPFGNSAVRGLLAASLTVSAIFTSVYLYQSFCSALWLRENFFP